MAHKKPPLICVMGPTASGKTDLAIALAQHMDCELISVDSALVYRGLDVGSAKPKYPHHLVDIRDPAQAYSAADFVHDVGALIPQIIARGRTPVLVGGTMLYFKALLEGMAQMPATDPSLRADILAEAQEKGWPELHRQLAEVDPEIAERLHPNHSQRISRALEVHRASGVPLSEWHRRGPGAGARLDPFAHFTVVQLAISPEERSVLHERIATRFETMMAQGFLDEVRGLYARGDLSAQLPAIRAVGYRQLWQHLEGQLSREEAVQKAVSATRRLAKRQLTWLRKWPDIEWIRTDRAGNVIFEGIGAPASQRAPVTAALKYLHQATT